MTQYFEVFTNVHIHAPHGHWYLGVVIRLHNGESNSYYTIDNVGRRVVLPRLLNGEIVFDIID